MWSLHNDCKDVIANSWNQPIVGCPMYVLNMKLKILKKKLKEWNKNCFGNVQIMVQNAETKLTEIQHLIQQAGYNDDLMAQEKTAQRVLEDALKIQDWFWQEKAHVNWHIDGDRNTSYFHRVTKIKNTTKLISSLKIDEDRKSVV